MKHFRRTLLLLLPALAAFTYGPDPVVTGLRLVPGSGGPELIVEMNGAASASVKDFTLSSPDRVVIDVSGARNGLAQSRFEGVDRGAVRAIRASQFAPGVVRVVVDLARTTAYGVTQKPDGVHVQFEGGAAGFSPWSSGAAGVAADPGPKTAPPAAAPPAPAPKPVLAVRPPAQRAIDVSFTEADIRDVLATFAEFSGRSIVPGSGVQGTVTATIHNQPWDVALRTILSAYGLAAQEMPSGIIEVDAVENLAKRETQEPLVTRTFRINYVPVDELVTTLTPLKSERGRISANASTNTLIVTDVASTVDDLAEMVRRLDVRTPQVSIEAKIIFVNRTAANELGIVYDLKDRRGSSINSVTSMPDPTNPGELTNANIVSIGGNSIAALGNANARVTGPSLQTIISLVMGRFTLVGFLEALQQSSLSDVQAAPIITTLDNQEAQIWVGERTPIRVVDLGGGVSGGDGGGGVSVPRATAQLVETGIRLRVTPHITADRHILMQLHAERSNAEPAAGDIGVIFRQQQGDTRLMVRDGETAVIGGLTDTEITNSRSGIPFLMDLPVIGRLFRTDKKSESKRDLLIMVTPHIIDEQPMQPTT
ncbi:MAG TPA: secretin N-terminal domain-containing protein [Longimicrobiaceae bacterium]|nr:secretin N-terminal domain-containing protein [Longimicrobiaceae bacterium]